MSFPSQTPVITDTFFNLLSRGIFKIETSPSLVFHLMKRSQVDDQKMTYSCTCIWVVQLKFTLVRVAIQAYFIVLMVAWVSCRGWWLKSSQRGTRYQVLGMDMQSLGKEKGSQARCWPHHSVVCCEVSEIWSKTSSASMEWREFFSIIYFNRTEQF